MTEKELRKLKKHDFLQLLLTQGQEAAEMQARFDETVEELNRVKANNDHLKSRLDDKDAQIEKLKDRLNQKDAQIRELISEIEAYRTSRMIELEEAGSIAEASLRLNEVFEVAQKAADQYLYNIKQRFKLAERNDESLDQDPDESRTQDGNPPQSDVQADIESWSEEDNASA